MANISDGPDVSVLEVAKLVVFGILAAGIAMAMACSSASAEVADTGALPLLVRAATVERREAAEPLAQTLQMGKSLLIWIETLQADAPAPCPTLPLLRSLQPAPTWPVVLGCAAAWRGGNGAPLPLRHAAPASVALPR